MATSTQDPDIRDLETRPGGPNDGEPLSPGEQAAFDQIEAGFYRDEGQSQRIHITKKQGIIGGAVGLVIGGSFGTMTIIQGPLEIIHFSKLLDGFHFSNNDDFVDGRTARLGYRIKTGNLGSAVASTRLGVVQNKFAKKAELKMQDRAGLKSVYNSTTGRLIGYEITDEQKVLDSLPEAFSDSPDADFDITSIRGVDIDGNATGTRVITFKDENFKVRRDFVNRITNVSGNSKLGSKMSARLLIRRGAVDMHPFNRARRAIDDAADRRAERRRERSEKRKNGADYDVDKPTVETPENEDGTPGTPDPGAEEAASEASEIVDAAVDTDLGDDVAKGLLRSRLTTAMSGAAAVAGVICTVRSIGNGAEDIQKQQVILPMMRMGMEIMASGSQVQSGQDFNMEELGILAADLRNSATGESWAQAKSIQAENGTPATGPDLPDHAKPDFISGKPAFFQLIDSIPFVGSVCGVQDAVGNLPVIKQVGDASSAALAAVLPIDEFIEGFIGWLAGDPVDTYAKYADLGNIANYGARLAANDQAIALGGAALDATETITLDNNSRERRLKEFNDLSISTRLFDLTQTNSLASTLLFTNRASFSVNGLIDLFSFVSSKPLQIFLPRGVAQSSYDYGFPEYGYNESEQNDPRFADPLENANIVENQIGIESLNEEYGDCFATTITAEGNIETNDIKEYNKIDPKCTGDNEDLLRYRFYIADTVTAHSMACYHGEESSCSQIGFESSGSSGGSTATPGTGDPGEDTSNLQCPSGTTDGGVHQDYGRGRVPTVRVRICNVLGVSGVNASIAGNVLNMLNAAQSSGLTLTGSSFRSFDQQVSLRETNGCPDIYDAPASSCATPTARPGSSNHEVGLAIDFENCRSRDTACYGWLNSNAANHGLRNLPSEPWHWSVNGN